MRDCCKSLTNQPHLESCPGSGLSIPPIRVRSHDEMVPAAVTKVKLKACRKTVAIGDTIFRCDQKGEHTLHLERGFMLRGQKVDTNIEYVVSWNETAKFAVRGEVNATTKST